MVDLFDVLNGLPWADVVDAKFTPVERTAEDVVAGRFRVRFEPAEGYAGVVPPGAIVTLGEGRGIGLSEGDAASLKGVLATSKGGYVSAERAAELLAAIDRATPGRR